MLQLKSLRKRDGVTQTQLAEYMGITQATLSGWETEKFEVDTASLKKLATYFNVSVDYLLGLTTQETPTEEKSSTETEELENIISYHRDGKTVRKQLSKKQMDAIHTIIETMKESDEDL